MDPLGRIYPCWEVINQKEHLLGVFYNGTTTWYNETLHKWRNNAIVVSDCIKCKYTFLCRGGCPAHQLDKKKCTHIEEITNHIINKTYVSVR